MNNTVSNLSAIGDDDVARFHKDGYLVVEELISTADAERIRDRFEHLFAGELIPASIPMNGIGAKA